MNKIPIILVCLILCVFSMWALSRSAHQPIIYQQEVFAPITPVSGADASSVLQKIARGNSHIKSVSAVLRISTNQPVKVWGSVAFLKKKNFRMQVDSMMGRELDIGSSETSDLFWFYSKRMKPSYLYYSRYTDIQYTRLKPMFHPQWLMESFGVVDVVGGRCTKKDSKHWMVEESRFDLEGNRIVAASLIDTSLPAVVGHYLFDNQGKLLASCEGSAFMGYHVSNKSETAFIPTKLKIAWHEEKQVLDLELCQIRVNEGIADVTWQMPPIKRRLDMGREPH